MSGIFLAGLAVKPIDRVQNIPSRTTIDYVLEVTITRRWKGNDLKVEAFWSVTKCRLVKSCRHFKGPYSQEVQEETLGVFYPEDGGTTILRKVRNYLPVDTA